MQEVADHSAKLFMGPSVFLGKGVPWSEYAKLYQKVYVEEGMRIIREDGFFIVIQTNAYYKNQIICRYHHLLELLLPAGWKLIDEKVWLRRQADFFQPPFSHVLVFVPPNGTATRETLNKTREWFNGVWRYNQTKGGPHASYPAELCRVLISATTKPKDLIVDPFAGTGMLLKVARDMQRKAIGYEIDEKLIPALKGNECRIER